MSKKVLISILGWEDRFEKGCEYDYNNYKFDECILFYYKDYFEQTKTSFEYVSKFCKLNGVSLAMPKLNSEDALENWKTIEDVMEILGEREIEILFDISTPPRETLWTILFFLKKAVSKMPYIYHKPHSYSEDWLSREPGNPRLLFKHSGLIRFEKSTLPFIVTGFDTERIKQLIGFYEPKKIVMLVQEGTQFRNSERNSDKIRAEIMHNDVEIYFSNSFELNRSYEDIKNILYKNIGEYNVAAISLGPKISGLSLYKYYDENPFMALCYVPYKEYNVNYSKGWDGAISGTLELIEPRN